MASVILATAETGGTFAAPLSEHEVLVFLVQLFLLVAVARVLGWVMKSIGQPAGRRGAPRWCIARTDSVRADRAEHLRVGLRRSNRSVSHVRTCLARCHHAVGRYWF